MTDYSGFKIYTTEDSISLPAREDIQEEYKWNLTDIYKSLEDWEAEFKWVKSNLGGYKQFIGSLGDSAEQLLKCLKFDDEIGIKLERLYLYAMLAKDSDMRIGKFQSMDERIKSLYSQISTVNSFIRPELLNIADDKLIKMVESNEELKVYKHWIEDLLTKKAHTLSKEEEKILALAGELTPTSYNVFSIFTNADMKFPKIADENGKEIQLSHGRYYAAMYSGDRNFRERTFTSYFKPFIDYSNTLSVLFTGSLKSNIFNAKARNYKSAREAALDKNNISVSVYDNLVKTVNDSFEPMYRWASLKKKILKIPELHPYDVYVTLFPADFEQKYPYEDAKKIVYDALRSLGDDYLSSLQTAFQNRWIDVYETQAKRSGAYSSGTTYGVHPYVLLNWTDLLNDVFTLSHEMGHNMHSFYTGKSQPYVYSNYTIFLAEVASTFNESLLLDYFIKMAGTPSEKLYFIEKYLNNITSTFYRQTMFAEFEMLVYEKTESGMALTSEDLCELYKSIYQKYWGPEMIIDKEEEFTWARVPHFYYNFYVYQYATGFAASEILSQKVITEG
ncbi:MAG TPA: oligoendopeptidase F, partial [Ignavibacteriaceae bacterium]|nr:oligoendopeptidase F [Ignavibacteriaceae bacterium]